ncbi:MAG: hypothetical protein SGJ19_28520 [Planctomycetia bacterium]|nr:hypothetical protein [Planctomycetia bacterium]
MRITVLALFGALLLFATPRLSVAGEQVPLDLSAHVNDPLDQEFHREGLPGNHLKALMKTDPRLSDVQYHIGEKMLQLGSKLCLERPKKIEGIPVDKAVGKLHFLHATGFGTGQETDPNYVKDGTQIGHYTIRYADDTTVELPIVYGEDVRDWWNVDNNKETKRGKVVWSEMNEASEQFGVEVRLYTTVWENPHSDKAVKSIDYAADGDTAAAPFCLAITAETP